MKRKIKVFSAIASLCLAVALMAFGVYAATQVTYTLSGTVEYSASIAVKAETTVEYTANEHRGFTDGLKTVSTLAYETEYGTHTFQNYDDDTKLPTTGDNYDGIAVDLGTSSAWRITVVVSTPQTTAKVQVTEPVLTSYNGDDNFIIVASADNASKEDVSNGASQTYIYYIYLVDATENVTDSATFSLQFTFERAEAV